MRIVFNSIVFLLLILSVQSIFADKFLPDKCTGISGVSCTEYSAVWNNGTNGTLKITFYTYKNIKDISSLLVKVDNWQCIVASNETGEWKNDTERLFEGKCDYVALGDDHLRAELYAENKSFGQIYTIIEGAPQYPQKVILSDIREWLITALFFLVPVAIAILITWACVRYLRKHLALIAWLMAILLIAYIVLHIAIVMIPSLQPMLNYLFLFIMPPLIAIPALLCFTAGIVAYRAKKKKRWALWIPIIIGGLFILLIIAIILFFIFVVMSPVRY